VLATIRDKVQGWIAAVVLGLIAIPFALWGINYYFEGGQLNVAAVNGTDISVDHYRRALEEQKRSLQRMLGGNVDPRVFDTPDYRARVLDGLIDQILVSSDLDSSGYRLSDANLAAEIRSAPMLQRDGKFDSALYEVFVRNQGMDARGFEASLRRDFVARQGQSGYRESAFVTDADVLSILRLQLQQREAAVGILPLSKFRDNVKVTLEEVQAAYQSGGDRFRTPERVRIAYVRLSASDLAREVRISKDELSQAEQEAKRSLASDEQRRASHILINIAPGADEVTVQAATAKIQGINAKIHAGGDFSALARQVSEDKGSARKGGDLGVVARGAFVPEFEKALFGLSRVGQVTGPIRTPYGLHLIKLTGIESAKRPTVDRSKLEAELRKRKSEDRFVELSERFHNLVYEQSDSLKPAADALGIKIETTGWITRGTAGTGILGNKKFLEAAFDPEVVEQGRNSPAIEIGRNELVALRVVEREASRLRPLEEVRAAIERELLIKAQGLAAENLAETAKQALAAGKTMSEVAKQFGLVLQASRVYSRQQSGVDGRLLAALFAAPAPKGTKLSSGRAAMSDGGQAVFQVRRIIEPEIGKLDTAEAKAIRAALVSRRGVEYFDDYRAGLRMEARIKRYKDQL